MTKIINIRSIVGLLCIIGALVLKYSNATVEDKQIVLDIPKPSQQIIEIVKPINEVILNSEDKAKLAVFNKEFASRIISYDTDVQQLNDVYVLSASYTFEETLKDKYNNLDSLLIDLIKKVTTDQNHKLTDQEKQLISEYFLGLSWVLINN